MLGFVEMDWVFGLAAPILAAKDVRCLARDAPTGSDPVVGLRGGLNERQNFERIKADGAGENDQLDDIDPALATFDPRDERLVTLEPDRQFLLPETRPSRVLI
jgi:hypothetical protein